MRYACLLIVVATTTQLANHDVVFAKQHVASSVVPATQINSIDTRNSKRFLRSAKWVEDKDSENYAEKEERGKTAAMNSIDEKFNYWLGKGKTGLMIRQKLSKHGIYGDYANQVVKKYGEMYRKEYGTNNGKPFTE
ncbi:Secreted RxLR effector peptide protein [Phytophthora palmivora]|uniref:RxLR effector protein n=1 Tax=Phytophthora palmivora TaxID=4796 RepID=A0A2P4YEP5_9STRA|nr:Secreted RxLR effector peptide protein [Phytophthora palmivora]